MGALDPYLAEQLSQAEKETEVEAQEGQTLDPSQLSGVRKWTAHPAFWIAAGTIVGVAGIAFLARRKKTDGLEDDTLDEEDDEGDESLFEKYEDTDGLDDDDDEPLAKPPAPKKERKPRAKKPKKTGASDAQAA